MKNSTFPRSGVLILGPNSIQSLLPTTLISQAESLLASHRIQDALGLVDQQRKRVEGKLDIDNDELEELRYVYQRIGFQCLSETLFEEAGNSFFAGDLDPRALISYYSDLRGSLFSETDTLDAYAGVAEHMPPESSIDEIIRNYSPHLAPSTRSAHPTAELRKALGMAAKEMLEKFLRKWRKKQAMGVKNDDVNSVDRVADTVLAKIFAEEKKTADLYAFLRGPNNIVLSELEPVLMRTGPYNALCVLYKERGEDNKLLHTWSKIVEGEWTDEDIVEPLSLMFTFLTEKRDRKLTQQWGIWLTKRDPERALQLLTSLDTSKRRDKPEDDLLMLQQMTDANPVAGIQFLQHLVLQKRSMNPDLHMQLANRCVDQLLACLADDSTSKLWRAKASSYASRRTDNSFLSYFASTTPDSEHKRVRLKTALFFQGSSLYEPELIRERLMKHQKVLGLEIAIINGKLGNHRAALSILVHDLRDAASAEAYCTLGGEVVPGKIAQSIGDKYGLQLWSSGLFSLPPSAAISRTISAATTGATAAVAMGRQKSVVDVSTKKGLLKVLLEVYINDGESERTAHLLNSQAMNLDVVDVIPLVPSDWPLNLMSSFLARSFRRTLHARHEAQIVKSISSGQNLEVADRSWLILREQGAIVEEANDDGGDGDGTQFDEKDALAEKVGLHLQDIDIGAGMNLTTMEENDGTQKESRIRGQTGTPPLVLR